MANPNEGVEQRQRHEQRAGRASVMTEGGEGTPGKNNEDAKKGEDGGRDKLWISVLALVVSGLSLALSWYWNSPMGEVTPIQPSGYAIVRGIDPAFEGEPEPGEGLGVGPYPSDHVILPIEWANSSGSSVLVKSPVLVLHALDQDGNPTGDERRFFMVGDFPEMSAEVLNDVNSKPHTFKNSVVLEPHSVLQSMAVFRVERWENENECFRFIPGQRYRVDAEYQRVPEDPKQAAWWRLRRVGTEQKRTEVLVERLVIQTTADFISPYGQGESIGWDFYSLLPGSRSTRDETPLRGDPEHRYSEKPPCA
jgi:hypothetical protein